MTNENIGYTTPPNSYTLGNQQTVFAAEDPFGYGAWGSISTGELLFVKKQGGAVVVNGDVEFPTSVLYLPGVHPTGDFYGRSEASEQGLYYCSEHQGAWLWNGGNTSQKISQQLRDDFYDVSTNVIDSNNYGFYAERWGQTILFSGNWLYNEQQGSWWKLYPTTEVTITPTTDITQTGHTFFWWLPGTFGYNLFALSLALVPGEPVVFQFDNRFTAPIWRWTSLPIHVAPTANHRVDVREVVIRASCPTAGAKVKVQIATWAGTSTAAIGTDPTILRFHVGVGALALEDIEITLTGLSTLDTNTRQVADHPLHRHRLRHPGARTVGELMRKHQLFIPNKAKNNQQQPTYGTDMRAIETAFNNLPTTLTPAYGITRMSIRYYATVRSYRTSASAVTLFKWTHTYRPHPHVLQLAQSARSCTSPPSGHRSGKVCTITGAGASTSTSVISMTGAWIMYVTLVDSVRRAPQTSYNINWCSSTTSLTMSKQPDQGRSSAGDNDRPGHRPPGLRWAWGRAAPVQQAHHIRFGLTHSSS